MLQADFLQLDNHQLQMIENEKQQWLFVMPSLLGDVPAIVALHHPDVVKYFGGNNVVIGRAALEKGLTEMFRTSTLEFIDNKLESLIFVGETAIETSIFTIRARQKRR